MTTELITDTKAQKSDVSAAPTTKAPQPTAAPFFLALGITMCFWGLVTSPVMSIGGLGLLIWSLWMWISAIAAGWT